MTNQITHNQAKALAAFIHELRPDWDTPGILHAVGNARDKGDGTAVAIAAIKAAATPDNRTPGIIPLDGEHWRDKPQTPVPPASSGKCPKCRSYHGTAECAGPPGDHDPGLASVRAALTEAKAEMAANREAKT